MIDAFFEGRMARKKMHKTCWFPIDFECSQFWIARDLDICLMDSLKCPESIDHLAFTNKRSAAFISRKLSTAWVCHDNHRSEEPEQDIQDDNRQEINKATRSFFITTTSQRDDVGQSARKKDHKGIDHSLQKRHRHHITIHDMCHLVSNNSLYFIRLHILKKSARNSHKRRILRCASCKCICFRRLVDPNFWQSNIISLCDVLNSLVDKSFRWWKGCKIIMSYEPDTIKSLRHPTRCPERDKWAQKTVDQSKYRKRYPRAMKRACNINAKNLLNNAQDNRPHDDNRYIGEYEEKNASKHRNICPEIIQKFPKSQAQDLL